MRIRKNDLVMVISGDHRGRQGRVLKVFPEKQRVIVEGINLIKRHTRPSQRNQQGGIIEKEAPIHVSNVMLIDPKLGVPTRIGIQTINHSSKNSRNRVRVAKKSGEIIVEAKVK
ncbi:MAG: 50S ribosomal protein L24 [candidate division KSB1 bacterium]|nr:50S ribosomal protein L24 [candidate division KSB1 bacterium]MDZ7272521.1 50S ribosomal protein L24 [candidate division KSB1 bacterium]MDZ7284455.1 50S ribosomal protein L24 [candidate division KSB1 bacterium]MDZ7297149.1 50S ribosomal protein L24 [candidate division KSB1 bacterium]MDZ7306712.1 50S ribosomal protein L24 [candidate division KSB1 bacterium]